MGHKTKVDDIPVGTWGNKYDTKNPIKLMLLNRFKFNIVRLINQVDKEINSIHEIGCGEGYLTRTINKAFPQKTLKGSDYAEEVINIAKENSVGLNIDYLVNNIYEVDSDDKADLIVCCEVLEHLERPEEALQKLSALNAKYYILSVPNEPIWRILQFMSGNNISDWGNTPGHINHWSSSGFKEIVSKYFDVLSVKSVLPWTLILAKYK